MATQGRAAAGPSAPPSRGSPNPSAGPGPLPTPRPAAAAGLELPPGSAARPAAPSPPPTQPRSAVLHRDAAPRAPFAPRPAEPAAARPLRGTPAPPAPGPPFSPLRDPSAAQPCPALPSQLARPPPPHVLTPRPPPALRNQALRHHHNSAKRPQGTAREPATQRGGSRRRGRAYHRDGWRGGHVREESVSAMTATEAEAGAAAALLPA